MMTAPTANRRDTFKGDDILASVLRDADVVVFAAILRPGCSGTSDTGAPLREG
jgi:hypothetical protein